jgi:hypothetical protein
VYEVPLSAAAVRLFEGVRSKVKEFMTEVTQGCRVVSHGTRSIQNRRIGYVRGGYDIAAMALRQAEAC